MILTMQTPTVCQPSVSPDCLDVKIILFFATSETRQDVVFQNKMEIQKIYIRCQEKEAIIIVMTEGDVEYHLID